MIVSTSRNIPYNNTTLSLARTTIHTVVRNTACSNPGKIPYIKRSYDFNYMFHARYIHISPINCRVSRFFDGVAICIYAANVDAEEMTNQNILL